MVSTGPRIEQKFHSYRATGKQNEGRQGKTGGHFLLVPPLGTQFGEFLSPCGRMRLSTERSAFAGLVSAGTSGHLDFDPNLAMYTSPKQDELTPKKEA